MRFPAGRVAVAAVLIASRALASEIDVQGITFDPVGPGKNVVHVAAVNKSSIDRYLIVQVQARSGDGQKEWKGTQGTGARQIKDGVYIGGGPNLKAGESKSLRYALEIPEPVGPRSVIVVQLFDSKATTPTTAFLTRRFLAGDLSQRTWKWEQLPAASEENARDARELLVEVQTRLRLGLYGRAQQLFSADWQFVEDTPLREWFRRRMYPKQANAFRWDAAKMLELQPRDVLAKEDGSLVLLAAFKDQVWPIEIVKEDEQWRIDWVCTAKEAPGLQVRRKPATTRKT